MNERVIQMRLISVGLLVLCTMLVWLFVFERSVASTNQFLEVHFFDVGQGDATFIETPDGVQVLIDGGADGAVLNMLSREMGISDRSIDVVVGTHPDTDHVGGLIDVFERYDVEHIMLTENEGESVTASRYLEHVADEGATLIYARSGQELQLGASTTLEVLFPATDPREMESNASSIILLLTYGESTFLFTGDSPKSIEEYVVSANSSFDIDVLKVGHHGSKTSTSEEFLSAVDPEYGVISAGKDNRYGHPHTEVTDVLEDAGMETFLTAEDGAVTFYSDGTSVWEE